MAAVVGANGVLCASVEILRVEHVVRACAVSSLLPIGRHIAISIDGSEEFRIRRVESELVLRLLEVMNLRAGTLSSVKAQLADL